MTIPTVPPTNIHTDLSVGEPVKNREISELEESYAVMPRIRRRMPQARTASATDLFMESSSFRVSIPCPTRKSYGSSALNDSYQDNHNCDDQENVDEAAHGGRREHPQEPQYDENNCDGVEHDKGPFSFDMVQNPVLDIGPMPLSLKEAAR